MAEEQKILLLTGASRGIGHATVKVFQERGWRLLTVSRQPFSEECRWPAARESHVQADLADLSGIAALAATVRARLPHGKATRAGQQRRHFAQGLGRGAARRAGDRGGDMDACAQRQSGVDCAARARADAGAGGGEGVNRQRRLDRRLARASVRRRRLRRFESRPCRAYARAGARACTARDSHQRHRARRDRHRDPVAGNRANSCIARCRWAGSAIPARSPKRSISCAAKRRPTSTARKSTSTAASMFEARVHAADAAPRSNRAARRRSAARDDGGGQGGAAVAPPPLPAAVPLQRAPAGAEFAERTRLAVAFQAEQRDAEVALVAAGRRIGGAKGARNEPQVARPGGRDEVAPAARAALAARRSRRRRGCAGRGRRRARNRAPRPAPATAVGSPRPARRPPETARRSLPGPAAGKSDAARRRSARWRSPSGCRNRESSRRATPRRAARRGFRARRGSTRPSRPASARRSRRWRARQWARARHRRTPRVAG